jgi:N-acetylgalactosamine-6-sulfatase
MATITGPFRSFSPANRKARVAPNRSDRPTVRQPNIVFILADDWGWGDLGCHGHPWLQTPQLDALAAAGTEFEQFNVLNPVCSPSRVAFMTGHFPSRYCIHEHFAGGMNHRRGMPDWLDPRAPLLPRLLRDAGYTTGHFGKWHLTNRGTAGAPDPGAYGFDEWAVFNGAELADREAWFHDTADNAADFSRRHHAGPFYVNVWLHEPHAPHIPTEASMRRHVTLGRQQQVYAAVISDADNAVGRVLTALRESGAEDNTLVIFTSDNGPEPTGPAENWWMYNRHGKYGLGTHFSLGSTGGMRGAKRSLYEGGVRVPFIARWPGIVPAGSVDRTTVLSAVDLLPTLVAAAGAALPPAYRGDGECLGRALRGRPQGRTKPLCWDWRGRATEPDWWPRMAIREGDWKLLADADGSRVELYRVADDRCEQSDQAENRPEITASLLTKLQAWRAGLPARPDPACCSPVEAGESAL